MFRSVAVTTSLLLTSVTLAACTSQTQKCEGGVCDIDLSGAGAKVQLGGDGGSDMELVRASGKTATVRLAGKEQQLTVGQPVQLDNATLQLVEVEGDDDVQIKLTGGATGSENAPQAN